MGTLLDVILFLLMAAICFGALYGVLVAGGVRNLNILIWRWLLSRRIGPVPEEAYVPSDVRSGFRPLGRIGILIAIGGVILFLVGLVANVTSLVTFGLLLVVAASVSWCAVLYWDAVVSSKEQKKSRREKERVQREEFIPSLSAQIEADDGSDPLLGVYLRFWRAAYMTDALPEVPLSEAKTLPERIKWIEAELKYVMKHDEADEELVQQANLKDRQLRRFVAHLKKLHRKRTKKPFSDGENAEPSS